MLESSPVQGVLSGTEFVYIFSFDLLVLDLCQPEHRLALESTFMCL